MTEVKKNNIKPEDSSRTGRKWMYWIFCSLALFVVALGCIYSMLLSGSASSSAVVRIPAGASAEQVRDSVSKYLGDSYAKKVARLVALRGTDLNARHGAYLIESGMSPLTAMRRLTSGPQEPLTITINGFRLLPVLEEKIAGRFDFSQDSLMNVLSDPEMLQSFGLNTDQALALFFNDSYDFYWSASPADVVEKIGAHYLDVWTPQRRAKADALGLTPADIMIIASIVDEETNAKEEKGAIGRLYINRLKKGMRLEADPTVRFAGGDFTVKRVRNPKSVDSPYNTYIHAGLPPGPIRTTSVETVDAVLDSQPHDYIFMCAKEDFSGRHNFAVTYAEHQANARRYKRELDRRGIY